MTLTSITTTRELAHRRNDGLDIRLLWDSATDQVTVALHDAKTGDGFEVEVGPDERALDVFHHPFAYAAFRTAARERRAARRGRVSPCTSPTAPSGPGATRSRPARPPRDVVVRVRNQGWTAVEFDIEHSYGGPTGLGRGSLPTAVFARRFDRIF